MGWKNVKEHYNIKHHVQMTEKGLCIGSSFIHNLIVINQDGKIVKPDRETSNKDLLRYQREFAADPTKLKELLESPDTFIRYLLVYTYDGGEIVKKLCEDPGWPNVTHDGLMMYENTFSTDRNKVIGWAIDSAKSRIASYSQLTEHHRSEAVKYESHKRSAKSDLAKLLKGHKNAK